ncbi:methionine--tRNA ligase [Aquicella lusitana]|uniref:Methionine--tRNA ligase n=1 Tax=Aquicella lusitana TaxID=254246 RepID=A0A370GBK6_9COXI|nr:methionine--tRNA ligase [Aquicella lusitana]RDI39854.1 methionyl-tRNA synthetase [Aquicella lusitana]VVC73125.1 Methionine--tRNA ligase [Aquicella lusitana]
MAAKRQMLVTSALIYANGTPHLGHLVGYIQADIWVRLQKMLGADCVYICGSDSHGTPIMIQAEKMGITPTALIEEMHREQLRDFTDFYVEFDNYYSTHSPENRELVELIFKRHLDAGNITKRTIKQLFDPEKNMFLPDRYIKGECPNCGSKDQYGDNCEVCGATYLPTDLKNPYSTLTGAKPIEKESEHYFFKLQNHENFLKDWTRRGHLQEQVSNKLDEWFKDGLKEWDISRDAPYFGFTIPGEKDKYFYVWLDAPIGYMASFKNLCERRKDLDFDTYWKSESPVELYHFIGKDIIYFHALFWPAILHGANFRTPTAIFVNGFLTVNGQKMSKSRGTFLKARTYLDHLNPEYLRYYFAAKLSDRIEDLDINFEDFMQRVNSDLVGKFINIASRCASFINKIFAGTLANQLAEPELYQQFAQAGSEIAERYHQLEYSQAIRQIMALADRANQYIDEQKPWVLAKDPARKTEVQAVCSMGINLFRVLMIYLKPVLPHTAKQVESFLNIPPLQWHDKDTPLLGHAICDFKPLIQRIDPKQIEAMKMSSQQDMEKKITALETPMSAKEKEEKMELISIEDFSKVDLRIAKILEAESVEGADKLLRLKVSLGPDETRQIFAGIKSAYQPEELIGRHVVVVANLQPRKMRFGISEGMVLAAGPGGKDLWVVSPDPGAESGMKVK